ncbi:MAG: STAS domain-containing protein, partial [Alphaproteobacteria bacterium]|nr:STAS domain-containing protein [Alphaproteobacteria bacterium]
MLTIRVPSRLSAQRMYGFLNEVIDEDMEPRDDTIGLDFSRLSFSDAAGVTMISNLIEWLRKRGVTVDFSNCDPDDQAISYLDDTGFFETYWGAKLSPFARVRCTTYPFKRLHCSDSHQWIDGNVFPWIANQIGVSVKALAEFKTCVRELFNNIHDHSTEEIGCMHVEKYPVANRLKIAVSDFGVGIPNEVRKV